MIRIGKTLPAVLTLCEVFLVAGRARAEDPAAAEALFQEGRKLLAEGQTAVACEKLKDSFALDPMSGTLLNLAACYEKQGKTATAWARFRNAASLAKTQGKAEQAAEANRRIKALEPDLSYLTIAVPEPVPGLEIKREDLDVSPATYGVQVPVDPGPVQVVASAPGYKTVKLSVEVAAKRDKRTVTVPKLEKMDKSAAAADASEPGEPAAEPAEAKEGAAKKLPEAAENEPKQVSEQPPFGKAEVISEGPGKTPWIIGGLGVAAGAAGGLFGYLAMQSNDDAKSQCPTRQNCSQSALNAVDRRNQQAMFADIGVGVGIVGFSTAVIWLLVGGPKDHTGDSSSLVIRPSVATDSAALWATGKF